jgi:hypothetical protein
MPLFTLHLEIFVSHSILVRFQVKRIIVHDKIARIIESLWNLFPLKLNKIF